MHDRPHIHRTQRPCVRRNTDNPYVNWSARVPVETREEFKALIPVVGSQTWFLSTALEKFLAMVEPSQDFQAYCHRDIQQHLHNEAKGSPLAVFSVQIPTELYDRFNALFPEWGATAWFMRRSISSFNKNMEGVVLDERVEDAVRDMLRRGAA